VLDVKDYNFAGRFINGVVDKVRIAPGDNLANVRGGLPATDMGEQQQILQAIVDVGLDAS
jgi:hypothetical protein